MDERISRRELALSAFSAVSAAAQQAGARPAEDPAALLEAARKQSARTREVLRKFPLPPATEPAFRFQP